MTTKVFILDNKRCQIVSDNNSLLQRLRYHLSYKMPGAEYIPAFQQGGWDGTTFLMSKGGLFSSGLLFKAREYLDKNGVEFDIIDRRKPVSLSQEIDLSAKLVKLGMQPRDYQNEIIAAALGNRKGIVRSCTGSGKTLTTAILSAKLNKPTIIYVIGLDLLKQFHDLFSSLFDEPIGYIGDGTCIVERINIATVWTIGSALRLDKKDILSDDDDDTERFDESHRDKILRMLAKTNVHIFDESHVITTNTIKAIYKQIDPEYIYGFSGTPFKDDGTDLLINSILGEQIIDVSASRLIADGYLAQPIIKFVPVPKMKGIDTSTYPSVYKGYVVENEERNALIVSSAKALLEKKYTPLVLFKQIRHGEILLDLMREAGIKCEMLYGHDSLERRTEVKEMLRDKKIDLLLASTIYDLGLDLPILSGLILCGSGCSSVRGRQRIGRVIRMISGKKFAAVVDFFDQVRFLKKHSLARYNVYSSEEGFKVLKCAGMKVP